MVTISVTSAAEASQMSALMEREHPLGISYEIYYQGSQVAGRRQPFEDAAEAQWGSGPELRSRR